jgi:hypothetical protein
MSSGDLPSDLLEATITSRAWEHVVRADLRVADLLTDAYRLAPSGRLLVPIDVRGFVAGGGRTAPRADVRSRALDTDAGDHLLPPPFTTTDALPAGVHLHWAMPDALTRGRISEDGPRDLDLPALPDRWLVARLAPVTDTTTVRPLAAWVLEADTGSVVPLTSYRPRPPERRLTAVSGGDPAWAAVYDDVRDRFAFHDADLPRGGGRATYVVVGWHGRDEDDPLHGSAGSAGAVEARLDELGWSLTPGPSAHGSADASQGGAATLTVRPERCLYHGTLYDVTLRPGAAEADRRPDPGEIHVAVGASLSEAVARRLSGGSSDRERLLTALGIGVLDRIQEPDGPAEVDQALHQHAFGSRVDDTSLVDRVRDAPVPIGQPREAARPAPEHPIIRPPDDQPVFLEATGDHLRHVRLSFTSATSAFQPLAVSAEGQPLDGTDGSTASGFEPGRIRSYRRPAPRWYHPTDPSLVLTGVHRSQRHGRNGRFAEDGSLRCRVSGQPVRGYLGLVDGRDVVDALGHAALPEECDALVQEAALTDVDGVDHIVRLLTAGRGRSTARRPGGPATRGWDAEAVRARLAAEVLLVQHEVAGLGDATQLAGAALRTGVPPPPVAVVPWQQPWVPLYLEWEVEARLADRTNGWKLGELDLEPGPGFHASLPGPRTIRGRTLLSAAATTALAAAIRSAIAAEKRAQGRGEGRRTSVERTALTELAGQAEEADLLGGTLDGFHDHLLGYDRTVAYGDTPDGDPMPVTPDRLPQLLRAGVATLTRLRVVDAFGQFIDLDGPLDRLERSEPLDHEDAGAPNVLTLTPRITAEARLQLRFLDAADDDAEARVDDGTPLTEGNPVAGWLLPDNADDALELFDPTGRPLGQLRATADGVAWEGTPGDDRSFGEGPVSHRGGPHLARLVAGMLERDARERARGREVESPLSALLRTFDTTRWSSDPFGASSREHVSELIGRPIAVVRASVELQVVDPADAVDDADAARARQGALAAFADRALPLRLGSLTRFDDGLLGVFVDDDYRRVRPTHALVKAKARQRGPGVGHLASAEAAAAMDGTVPEEPIVATYVADEAELSIHPGHRRTLTLLMLPGHGVHATCGLLPRKRLELVRSWTSVPLERITPSFRIGPVLLEPGAVRLPRISALPKAQEFSRRDTPTTWRHDPIQGATTTARLPDRPATIQEGWVRAEGDDQG